MQLTVTEMLKYLNANEEFVIWAERRVRTFERVWEKCSRGDWLLTLAGNIGVRREDLVLATCACIRLNPKVIERDSAEIAIATAEQWALGDPTVTRVDVYRAAEAAFDDDEDSIAGCAALTIINPSCAETAVYRATRTMGNPIRGLREASEIVKSFWSCMPSKEKKEGVAGLKLYVNLMFNDIAWDSDQ